MILLRGITGFCGEKEEVDGAQFKSVCFYAIAQETANIFPIQIIIGAQCLHAVGGAWTSQYNNEDSVSVAYIGDGGTSEGDFHDNFE